MTIRHVQLAVKSADGSWNLTIEGQHKTGTEVDLTLPNDIYDLLQKFSLMLVEEYQMTPDCPVFCNEDGKPITNLSKIISATAEAVLGQKYGGNYFRHAIYSHANGVDKGEIAKALCHSEAIALKAYIHKRKSTNAFVGKCMFLQQFFSAFASMHFI